MTLLKLAILPSSWVLAVLDEANQWGLNTKEKEDFQALWPKNIFFCVDESPLELLKCGETGLNRNTT